MKQTLQLKIGQHLTMTPQLQQAIKLLQLSTLELQAEIQDALDSNLMLETADDVEQKTADSISLADENFTHSQESNLSRDQNADADAHANDEQNSLSAAEPLNIDPSEQEINSTNDLMPDELPMDGGWDDVYEPMSQQSSSSSASDDDRDFTEYTSNDFESSLQEHLLWQMEMTHFSPTDHAIALAIIDSIDESGYLTTPLTEIYDSIAEELQIDFDEAQAVLHRIQSFDPLGVAAASVQECLLIQLQHLHAQNPHFALAQELLREHLEALGNHDYNQLMKKLQVKEEELKAIISLIQSLQPKPGSLITSVRPEYIVPDVFVKKTANGWRVDLNPDIAPNLRINSQYAALMRSTNSQDTNYLKGHLQEAKWFIKSLQSRNETLLKVATCIVQRQRPFFDYGEQAMKPLVLRDVAEEVEMHESTVSRVTTQKYMHTPRGIFEFKYFFSSHVGTTSGGEASSVAIRALIKQLVDSENAGKPLSDSKLAQLLLDKGMNVARRTVAKYREALSIPPSNERKRLT